MAYYAALISVVQLLKDIIHHDRYPKILHVSLYEKFNLLLELLDDYSPKDHGEQTNDILERRIRDVAYRGQDMIESHISATSTPHIYHRLWDPTSRHVPDYNKYDPDLEKVKTEVDSILEELTRIKAESNTGHEDLQLNSDISVEASRVQEPSGKNTMLVFHENLRTTIKAQLCGESPKLEVISIVGMGVLGKTTLARNIFDDRLIHDHFDCCVWVTISQDYHLRSILLAIINSLNIKKKELEKEGEKVLRQRVYQNLFGRRYLIVMDDVWETKFRDDVRRIFPDNSNGRRIIITTRLSNVADCASSSKFLNQMQFLDEDQSWTVLREKVFAAQEHCPKELEVIGKLIAKNCGGLPLAIVVIVGVLSNVKKAQCDWKKVARKVILTAIGQNNEHLSRILFLSYNHLPHHLKPCFLYLGGYPEDHEMRISQLIKLWVAEGFLKENESKSLEEVGEEYLKDLVNRNLVLITRKKSNGKFKCCIIHDVLRELCCQRARDENFLLCVQRKKDIQKVPIKDVRRACIQIGNEYFKIPKYIKKHNAHIRSLINHFPKHCPEASLLPAATGCKLLRILDTGVRVPLLYPHLFSPLEGDYWNIAELLHLRYLKLVGVDLVGPGIIYLQTLQTLISVSRASLPSGIWKMPQLRHVMSKEGATLPPIPFEEIWNTDGVPLLGSLQTLWILEDFRFTIGTIKMMPKLKKLGFLCHCK